MPSINDTYDIDIAVLARVYGEYLQMPGLQLTLAQASRLWNLNRSTSAHVLDKLVRTSFLRRVGDQYVRADSARACA